MWSDGRSGFHLSNNTRLELISPATAGKNPAPSPQHPGAPKRAGSEEGCARGYERREQGEGRADCCMLPRLVQGLNLPLSISARRRKVVEKLNDGSVPQGALLTPCRMEVTLGPTNTFSRNSNLTDSKK